MVKHCHYKISEILSMEGKIWRLSTKLARKFARLVNKETPMSHSCLFEQPIWKNPYALRDTVSTTNPDANQRKEFCATVHPNIRILERKFTPFQVLINPEANPANGCSMPDFLRRLIVKFSLPMYSYRWPFHSKIK